MMPKWKKRVRWLVWASSGVFVLAGLAWVCAPWLLVVDSGTDAADAVVVLGGEPWTRPARAVAVYREIMDQARRGNPINPHPSSLNSPLVLVSGNGDCEGVRKQIMAGGVPATVITVECESRSTWENAQFSVKLLRERNSTNVIIVTSWFHSRRSLACFSKAAPEIQFRSCPTASLPSGIRHPDAYTVRRVFQEYAKIVYYWVFYGVPPW
jgi:uncharacterized SAM-binding protein YcdF (DUF218 family)